MRSYKSFLSAAVAGGVLLASAGIAHAQAGGGENLPYVMANGTRTANYEAAVQSWRDDPQFAVDYTKRYLGLEHAYARGLTGKGVTIGINDSGVHASHPLFAGEGKLLGLDTGVSQYYGNFGRVNERMAWENHGTHVAGTAAGNRMEGGTMFGNAFGSNIYAATTNFSSGDFRWAYDNLTGNRGYRADYNLEALARTGVVRIINNSWGASNTVAYNAPRDQVLRQFQEDWSFLKAPVLENDVLMVFSAGNGGGAHAGYTAVAPLFDEDLRGNWLSVTNYQGNDDPSSSTSFCGQSATWCVTGPGHQIISGIRPITMDVAAIRRDFNNANYRPIFTATTVTGVYNGARTMFLADLNDLLTRMRNAQAAGTPLDMDAERLILAEKAATYNLLAASRISPASPSGGSYEMGNLFGNAGNVALFGDEFVAQLMIDYEAARQRTVDRYFTYGEMGYGPNTGTSMSAPNISGFAALLVEAFPEYNMALLTDILTSSSRDIDVEGVDLKTGWGVPQMQTALNGPTALRAVRDVNVLAGTVDIWSNDIGDARDRYSPEVRQYYENDIGGLKKVGGGELVLTGNINYTGPTSVTGGLLTVDGTIATSALSVAEVGIIGGTGTLASLIAESGGVVAPGNSANPFGTLSVTGNATFRPGSFLWVRSGVNGDPYSKLSVGGVTTLEGGNVIVKADQGVWNLRTRGMRILTSTGGVNGTFAGVSSDLAFLKPTLAYEKDAVLLTLTRNDVSIGSAGKTDNERAVGGALDIMTARNSTGNLALENAILDGSLAAVSAALPQLTGEVHASLTGLATADTLYIRDAMLDRGRGSAGVVQQMDNRGLSFWASGIYGNGKFDGSDQHAGYRNTSSSYAVGIDKQHGDAHFGVAVGQNKSKLETYSLATSADVTSTQVGLYGGLNAGNFAFRLGGSWITSDFSGKRSVALNAFRDNLNWDYEGDGWQAYAEASWIGQFGNSSIEPYLNYTRVDFETDVLENGGDAALSGTGREVADLVTAGLRTRTLLAGGDGRPALTLVGNIGWTENVNDNGARFRANFADGPGFNVTGHSLAGDALQTQLSINIATSGNTNWDIGYSGTHQDDFSNNRVFGRYSVKF